MTENGLAASGKERSWGSAFSKTVNWHDPITTASASAEMSGLEFITAMRDGKLPAQPIAQLLGIEIVTVDEGEITFCCAPDSSTYNPLGAVHGGLVCTLLDSACGWAVHTLLPNGVSCTSIEIKVSYLRAVSEGDSLTTRGWVSKLGNRVGFAEAEVLNQHGKHVAKASSSLLLLR